MSDALEARIRKIEAYQEICNIQARYSYFVDNGQIDDLLDLFTEEFIWEAGFDRMVSFSDKGKLAKFLGKAGDTSVLMRHLPVTPCVEVNGDEATCTWYLFGMVTSLAEGEEKAHWTHGTYNNAYRFEDGAWKLSRLSFKYAFLTPYEDGWVKTPVGKFL